MSLNLAAQSDCAMFTLDYVRPIGEWMPASSLCSALSRLCQSNDNIYGFNGEFYYFRYGNNFAKAVHKKYSPYLDEIYKIEAGVNGIKIDRFFIDPFVVYVTPVFCSGDVAEHKLSSIAKDLSTRLEATVTQLNLRELALQNEKMMMQLFVKYSPIVCEILGVGSIKKQIELFQESASEYCHNDFHSENIFVGNSSEIVLIDFEMTLFHRSNFKIDLINYSRSKKGYSRSLIKLYGGQYYRNVSKMLAVKNLTALLYLCHRNNWSNDAEFKKFRELFHQH